MSRFFARSNNFKIPQRHADPKHNPKNITGGKAQKGIVVCKDCKHIFFKKEWKHPDSFHQEPNHLEVHYTLCPACTMKVYNLYEGEVVIKDVPEKVELELNNLISAYGSRAERKDSQHRIIKIISIGQKGLRVLTSENQLAVKLAKKISSVFRGMTELHISHRSEPYEVERVSLAFV